MSNVTEAIPHSLSEMTKVFSWVDFTLFAGMLGISALIGIYYGCCGSKQNTTDEYLLGGKSMSVIPVAMSLIASHTSGVALLAVPADIYRFGATYIWMCLAIMISSIFSCYVFMPVFMNLQLTSTYEYLNIRFDNRIRVMASFLVIVQIMLFNPIVIYIPALAFAQATGIHFHIITPMVCIICIFYTTVGGLKGVVTSDAIQTLIMAISLIVVFYLGISSVGGLSAIWEISLEGNRLDILDFGVNPTKRDSFWAFVIGSSASWISNFAVHQSTMQRFQSVAKISAARKTILGFCIGIVIVKAVSTITGLIIYANYADCDLLSSHQVSKADQLLPYYVMDVAGKIPGLSGIFIAGVFSAGLSTLSTNLNSLSAIIYADFLSFFLSKETKARHTGTILKAIVVISGIISTLLVFVVEHLGGILPLVISVGSVTSGPLLGLFCLGMLFPKANTKGALYGGVVGLILSSCMVFGNKYYASVGMLEDFSKPVSTKGCKFYVDSTLINDGAPDVELAPFVFRISFWYYSFIGTVLVVIIGLVVSWFTSDGDPPAHPELISPVIRYWMSKKNKNAPPTYSSVNIALSKVVNQS